MVLLCSIAVQLECCSSIASAVWLLRFGRLHFGMKGGLIHHSQCKCLHVLGYHCKVEMPDTCPGIVDSHYKTGISLEPTTFVYSEEM